jgi:hypothetical protein
MIRTFTLLLLTLALVFAPPAWASSRVVSIATAEGSEHTNSTTEASIARYSFGGYELLPGKVYDFECGVVVNSTNATDTLTLAVRFGSSSTVTSNTAIATSAAVDVANGDVAIVRGSIEVQSATRAVFLVQMAEPDAIATITVKNQGPVLFTLAAGTAYYLDVTADWSVAHADNQVAAMSFSVTERT